jgi:hypothetical protein
MAAAAARKTPASARKHAQIKCTAAVQGYVQRTGPKVDEILPVAGGTLGEYC